MSAVRSITSRNLCSLTKSVNKAAVRPSHSPTCVGRNVLVQFMEWGGFAFVDLFG